jgi:co-chaperonin GroES (HSP10)
MIDFKVPRAKDCVLIDTKKWVQNTSCPLTIHRMSGRDIPTYIAKAVSVNAEKSYFKGIINEGDTLLLTRVASDISQYRTFGVEVDDNRFYNVPIMQVIGTFENGEISFSSLRLILDKILVKKVDASKIGKLELPEANTMIGEVVKTGWCKFDREWNKHPLRVNVGDKILIRDNVTTEIILDGEKYYATEEAMVVGIFKGDSYSLEEAEIISNSILMESYIPEKAMNSTLYTPLLNFEDEDVTNIYNRDLFKIVAVDKSLTNLEKGDIILLDRNITNYVYLHTDKYFILSGMDYVDAKVIE